MFIRQRKNPSGSISIQIIDKSSGKYKVIETIAPRDPNPISSVSINLFYCSHHVLVKQELNLYK